MPLPRAAPDERVIAGVCAGIAQALAVDVTLVRLVFALLALAGGAGVVLYLALWLYDRSEREWWVILAVVVAGALLLHAVGISDRAVAGLALIAVGLAFAWRRGGASAPTRPVS
jgi:phage shock protein PspC (stress-responsive transcriptional regulator)